MSKNIASINVNAQKTCTTFETCPKCLGSLEYIGPRYTSKGQCPLYKCNDCKASFGLFPITVFEFFEVHSK